MTNKPYSNVTEFYNEEFFILNKIVKVMIEDVETIIANHASGDKLRESMVLVDLMDHQEDLERLTQILERIGDRDKMRNEIPVFNN